MHFICNTKTTRHKIATELLVALKQQNQTLTNIILYYLLLNMYRKVIYPRKNSLLS